MQIITCFKIVPDAQDLAVMDDGSISTAKAELNISEYDLNAVEAGMQIIEAIGGKVTALSVGPDYVDNSKLRKSILSRGPQELFLVKDELLATADAHLTAQTLAAAVRKIGLPDLIICGEGSADIYAQQVGIQLGQILGLPTVNGVSKITPEGNKLVAERSLEEEIEVLEIPLPAVICVTTDINITRVPSMKDILGAGKKPCTVWSLADLGQADKEPLMEQLATRAPETTERKKIITVGDGREQVEEFYKNILAVLQ